MTLIATQSSNPPMLVLALDLIDRIFNFLRGGRPALEECSSHLIATHPPILPQELIDHIFSFLRGDRPALEECSKAHPIFSSIAEPYLYADILIPMNCKTTLSELHKHLSENPYILDFPRTLEFRRTGRDFTSFTPEPDVQSIMLMIPRMTNLVSLTLVDQWPYRLYEDFISTFKTCLHQSTIEELCLESFRRFPISILDGKSIKKLTLSNCTVMWEDEFGFTSDAPHQSLETLIIRSYHNPILLLWASQRAASLTTLELRDSLRPPLTEFSQVLGACSKTLTRLHLDIDGRQQSIYRFDRQSHSYGLSGRWINDHLAFPFTLSAHTCLKDVSIFAKLRFDSNARIHCALPAILRLIKTAPSIPFFLSFRRDRLCTARIEPLNLSPLLDRFRSDFSTSGFCPRVDLHVNHDLSDCPLNLAIPDVFEMTDDEDSD